MNSAKRSLTKAQQAPSGAQSLRLSPSQVAFASAQRRNGGTASQNSASMTTVMAALPGLPNSARTAAWIADRARIQRPCSISRRFQRFITAEVARLIDRNTPISSVITSTARPDWFSTVRPKICSTSG